MDVDRQQAKMKEFMSLLPLTVELAGLSRAEPTKFFNESQLEARATAIKNAYKMARTIVLEIAKPAE